MVAKQMAITVPPDSELSLSLTAARATGEPVIVDTGETIYTLVVDRAEPGGGIHDPQAVAAALQAFWDSLEGVDVEQLHRDLRDQREQDSSGRPAYAMPYLLDSDVRIALRERRPEIRALVERLTPEGLAIRDYADIPELELFDLG